MELAEIRKKIDALDEEMLTLFLERMDLAEEIAAYKNEHHLPIVNRSREREILSSMTRKAGESPVSSIVFLLSLTNKETPTAPNINPLVKWRITSHILTLP